MKKAIIVGFYDKIWIEALNSFFKEKSIIPLYWLAHADQYNMIIQKYPEVLFHSYNDANKGIFPFNLQNTNSLSLKLIEDMSEYETMFYKILDRYDPGGIFLFEERVRLYHRVLLIIHTLIESIKPEILIFFDIPHSAPGYLIYAYCKKFDIGVNIIPEFTHLNGFKFFETDFTNNNSKVRNQYENGYNKNIDYKKNISIKNSDYITKIQSNVEDYKDALPSVIKQLNRKRKRKSIKSTIRYYLNWKKPLLRDYNKKRGEPFETSVSTRFSFDIDHLIKGKIKKRNLLKFYNKSISKVNLDTIYVYFPLHYQPERTTAPQGASFVFQILALDILSKAIPDDWIIYVREHKIQFDKRFYGERSRDIVFYKDLLAYKNIRLLSVDDKLFNSFDLIDNSQFVATITGTVGWESIWRDKPVLMFSNTWFQYCEGIFRVTDIDSVREAIDAIQKSYTIDKNKQYYFIKALEGEGFQAYFSEGRAKYEDLLHVSSEESVNRLFLAYCKFYDYIFKDEK